MQIIVGSSPTSPICLFSISGKCTSFSAGRNEGSIPLIDLKFGDIAQRESNCPADNRPRVRIPLSPFALILILCYKYYMKIYLRDKNSQMTEAWNHYFADNENFHISCGGIFDSGIFDSTEHMNCEGIVSPANSFGFMDGGIDYVYSEYFGWEMSEELRRIIHCSHDGELLVGNAAVVEIGNGFKYLISAPTMRVPMNIANTVNVYLAFRAALTAAEKYKMSSILCPGLGTAIGKVPHMLAAKQMHEAYQNFISPQPFDILGTAYHKHNDMLHV